MKRAAERRPPDRGLSTVELAFLAPAMVTMIAIIVTLGILVDTHNIVDGAARDAARAGSQQGDTAHANPLGQDDTEARRQAVAAAQADLGTRCSGGMTLIASYVPKGSPPGPGLTGIAYYKVTITCSVKSLLSYFGASNTITATSAVPVDPFQASTGGP